jgi:hypothetical protein
MMRSQVREDLREQFMFSTDDGIEIDNDQVYETRYNGECFEIFIGDDWHTIEGIDFDDSE